MNIKNSIIILTIIIIVALIILFYPKDNIQIKETTNLKKDTTGTISLVEKPLRDTTITIQPIIKDSLITVKETEVTLTNDTVQVKAKLKIENNKISFRDVVALGVETIFTDTLTITREITKPLPFYKDNWFWAFAGTVAGFILFAIILLFK